MCNDQIKLKREHEAIVRENQGEEQGERRPSKSNRTQNTTATYSITYPNTNKHSATTQKHPNLVKSEGKIRGMKKVSKCDEDCMEELKKTIQVLY